MSSTKLIQHPKSPGEHVTHYTLLSPAGNTEYHEMESGLLAKGRLTRDKLSYLTAEEWRTIKDSFPLSKQEQYMRYGYCHNGYSPPKRMWTSRLGTLLEGKEDK